jgi:predicted nucleic acid-binding protein
LRGWLKQQAGANHHSVNKEVIAALDSLRKMDAVPRPRPSLEEIMDIARRFSSLPVIDSRSDDEIVGNMIMECRGDRRLVVDASAFMAVLLEEPDISRVALTLSGAS